MATQTTTGKAFEYALAASLQEILSEKGPCQLQLDAACSNASASFESLPKESKTEMQLAAIAAVRSLLQLEAALARNGESILPLTVLLMPDKAGMEGDVRDVIVSNSCGWQIGISAKHQHEAVKHSRLSSNIDFGQKWLGMPCSSAYFDDVLPVFDRLTELKKGNALWQELPDKEDTVYGALLEAFRSELLRIDKLNPGLVAAALAQYLIGRQDFYKIVKLQSLTKLQVFNFNGTLNRGFGGEKPLIHMEKLKLPRRIVELDFKIDDEGKKSSTTLELICDGGWQIAFRIHNASSRVEPSLKFDISLIGRPNSLPTFHVLW